MSGMTYQEAYAEYASYVETCISFRVRDMDAREDIAQDTWTKVWKAWTTVDHYNLKAWLCKVACNCAYDHLRNQRRNTSCSLEAFIEEFNFDFPSVASVEEQCESMDLLQCMLASPYGEQVRLLIASDQCLSGKELAEHYGITPDMAKTRVYRARIAIRERFAKEVA